MSAILWETRVELSIASVAGADSVIEAERKVGASIFGIGAIGSLEKAEAEISQKRALSVDALCAIRRGAVIVIEDIKR
jgi:hypothetical protein